MDRSSSRSSDSPARTTLGPLGSWLLVGIALALFAVYLVTHWDAVQRIFRGFTSI